MSRLLLSYMTARAVQDYDYIAKCSERLQDPFLTTGEYMVDNYVIMRLAPVGLLADDSLLTTPSIRSWQKAGEPSPEPLVPVRHVRMRLATAAVGGLFLLAPMWLMMLVRWWRYTSLVVTTVFVAVFGLAMRLYLKDFQDALASTAAYAAVLVVFVGTSSPGGS